MRISGTSHTISHKWIPDMETNIEYLSFRIGEHPYPTHYNDVLLGCEKAIVGRKDFDHVIFTVKRTCREVASKLIAKLENWFPDVDLLNALGIVHPQFWMKDDVEEAFGDHLSAIREHFYKPRSIVVGGLGSNEIKVIDHPLDFKKLLDQQSFFKMTMQASSPKILSEQEFCPMIMNPMTRLWKKLRGTLLIRLKMG